MDNSEKQVLENLYYELQQSKDYRGLWRYLPALKDILLKSKEEN